MDTPPPAKSGAPAVRTRPARRRRGRPGCRPPGTELAGPPLLSGSRAAALRLARPEVPAARGRGAQGRGGAAGGCGGAFSCANPAPGPRPRGPAPRRADAAFPLGTLRGPGARARGALTHRGGGGEGRPAGRGGAGGATAAAGSGLQAGLKLCLLEPGRAGAAGAGSADRGVCFPGKPCQARPSFLMELGSAGHQFEWSRSDHGSRVGHPCGALSPLLAPGAHAPPSRSHRPFTLPRARPAPPTPPGPPARPRPPRRRCSLRPAPLRDRALGSTPARSAGIRAARPSRTQETPRVHAPF